MSAAPRLDGVIVHRLDGGHELRHRGCAGVESIAAENPLLAQPDGPGVRQCTACGMVVDLARSET